MSHETSINSKLCRLKTNKKKKCIFQNSNRKFQSSPCPYAVFACLDDFCSESGCLSGCFLPSPDSPLVSGHFFKTRWNKLVCSVFIFWLYLLGLEVINPLAAAFSTWVFCCLLAPSWFLSFFFFWWIQSIIQLHGGSLAWRQENILFFWLKGGGGLIFKKKLFRKDSICFFRRRNQFSSWKTKIMWDVCLISQYCIVKKKTLKNIFTTNIEQMLLFSHKYWCDFTNVKAIRAMRAWWSRCDFPAVRSRHILLNFSAKLKN